MSANKWTPGPWLWRNVPGRDLVSIVASDTVITSFFAKNKTHLANARLIAASPDLYEALALAESKLAHSAACVGINPTEDWEEKGSVNFSACKCVISNVRAALAKARGES